MYYCKDCKQKFENFGVLTEGHGLDSAPYESIAVCPFCRSENIIEYAVNYCRYCGAKLNRRDGVYCNSACRKKGEILWRKEALRRKQLEIDPIQIIIKKLEEYNRLHNTDYSYGKFVSVILPGYCL